jgi:hypothetical protein
MNDWQADCPLLETTLKLYDGCIRSAADCLIVATHWAFIRNEYLVFTVKKKVE